MARMIQHSIQVTAYIGRPAIGDDWRATNHKLLTHQMSIVGQRFIIHRTNHRIIRSRFSKRLVWMLP